MKKISVLEKPAATLVNDCTIPELLTTPSPEKVNEGPDTSAMENEYALAPGSKIMRSTSSTGPAVTWVRFEIPKVAMSSGPLGTVVGVQLVAVLQSPLVGFRFQVALPPTAQIG